MDYAERFPHREEVSPEVVDRG